MSTPTYTEVDEMPTACVHGESTERRCDICFSTNGRQMAYKYTTTAHIELTTLTPIGSDTMALHRRQAPKYALPQLISNLNDADYTWTFDMWIIQVNWQFNIHGIDAKVDLEDPKVDWHQAWLDHATPLAGFKMVHA